MVSLARPDDSWRGCHSQSQPDPAFLCMPLHPSRHEQGNGNRRPVQLVDPGCGTSERTCEFLRSRSRFIPALLFPALSETHLIGADDDFATEIFFEIGSQGVVVSAASSTH